MSAPNTVLANKAELCLPATCRVACALEVIDGLLRAAGAVRGEEVDSLLDLRWVLRERTDAEAALALFCQLRRSMEERHYLAFYRLRRWLQNHIEVNVRLRVDDSGRTVGLKLERYCVEAIRHQCLHAGRAQGEPVKTPRVTFAFRSVEAVQASLSEKRCECC